MNFHVQQGCVWPISMNLKIHSFKISVPLVFSSSKYLSKYSAAFAVLSSVWLYLISCSDTSILLTAAGKINCSNCGCCWTGSIPVEVKYSQLRPLHVLNLTPSWDHPIQGYTKWQLHNYVRTHSQANDLLEGSTSIWGNPDATSVFAILKSSSKVNLPSSWSLQSIS